MTKHSHTFKMLPVKWGAYIWLAYLPYTIIQYLPVKRLSDWFWLGIILIFLINYIATVERPQWRPITMPIVFFTTALFSVVELNNYLIIYPAWLFSTIIAQRQDAVRRFTGFALIYYVILATSLIRVWLLNPVAFSSPLETVFSLAFPILSPFLAFAFARSTLRNRDLDATNRRLEAIIQRNERERIARDLHDTLGQSFSMITIKAELAAKLLEKAPEKVPAELADIAATSRENLNLVRAIVNDLHTLSISEVLLDGNQNLREAGVILETDGEQEASAWPTKIQQTLAAVLQEAFTNVIQHAHANEVQVAFQQQEDYYQIVIKDDGYGAKTKTPEAYTRRGANGIAGMKNRMEAAHGTFAIEGRSQGTAVILRLPVEDSHD